MEALANRAASFFITQGKATADNRDIFVYGLIVLFSMLVNILVSLVIGCLFEIFLPTLMYIIPYSILRTSAGGYHAKSFWGCIIASALIQCVVVSAILFVPSGLRPFVTIGLLILAAALVFPLAPVQHPNRPLTASETLRFRGQARWTVGICSLLSIALLMLHPGIYPFCIALGVAVAGVALLPYSITKRGVST